MLVGILSLRATKIQFSGCGYISSDIFFCLNPLKGTVLPKLSGTVDFSRLNNLRGTKIAFLHLKITTSKPGLFTREFSATIVKVFSWML